MKFVLPLISFFGALCGVFHYLKSIEENACDMTYMFEYPEYLKIPLNYNSSVKYPRYNLFVYAEGKYVDDLSRHKYRGIPVLFIPGNAGSHRQVRSLASVALRMSQSRQTTLHFNFFAVHFNEEISALYGGTLGEQTEFVLECIEHIQTLYSEKKKLILIGHSMGGIIAKAVFSLPNFDASNIFLILTLASPHRKPVLAMDSDIVALYERIKLTWRYRLNPELRNIPIVSIGGGQRDVLVRSDLILNSFDHSSPLDIHVLTSSIPGIWLSTDHLAIVWCKQLVLTIVRSLFDLSNHLPSKASEEPAMMENILKFHYVSRSSGNSWPMNWFHSFHSFPSSGQWIVQEGNVWRFSRSKVLSSIYLLIPFSRSGSILIIESGLVKGDWIFGCVQLSSTNKSCTEGENVSNFGEIIPSRKANTERRMVRFKIQDLQQKGFVSLLVYIAPVQSQVEILSEVYEESQRLKHFSLPSLYERLSSFTSHRVFTISLVEQTVHYNVTVSTSAAILQAAEFQLETRLCRAGSVVGQGLIKVKSSWSGEFSYYHIRSTLGGLTRVPVILHSLPPAQGNPVLNFEFILDPECSVVFSAKFPFYLMVSQFVKFYGPYTVCYVVSLLLVLLGDHMISVDSQGMPSSVYEMLGTVSSFLTLVVMPSFIHFLTWISRSSVAFLPKPDEMDESYEFFSSLFLRTLLYFIASGIVLCLYAFIEFSLRAISIFVMYWKHKNILKTTQMPLEQILKDRVQVSKNVLVCSSVIAAVCVGISSSLASITASVYYFFKLSSMHTRCKLEEDRRGSSAATCKWYFHSLMVMLWFAAVFLTFPGFVTWWKNIKFSLKLSKDIYVFPSTVMVICVAVLWQLPTPIIHRFKYKGAALLIKIIAVVTTLYGISSIYRLLYYIAATSSIICVQQTCGYFHGLSYLKYD